jgi:hypothetical protein
MNILAKKYVGIITVLLLWGMAISYAKAACIDEGPPLERSHNIYSIRNKSLGSEASPLSLQTFDLLSLVLPRGRADDWQVEIVESSPGLVRIISPQELNGVLDSKRFITSIWPITGNLSKSGVPRLHFGMMRPGKVKLRIKYIAGKESYSLHLNIIVRPNIEQKGSVPGRKGEPVPSC